MNKNTRDGYHSESFITTPRGTTNASPRSTPRRWIPCLSRGISTGTHGPSRCPCARGRSSRAASRRLDRSWRRAPGRSSRWNRRTPPARAVGRRPRSLIRRRHRRRSSWGGRKMKGGGGERRGNVSDDVKIKRPTTTAMGGGGTRRDPGKKCNSRPKQKINARDAT